jgi:hypothetical protein
VYSCITVSTSKHPRAVGAEVPHPDVLRLAIEPDICTQNAVKGRQFRAKVTNVAEESSCHVGRVSRAHGMKAACCRSLAICIVKHVSYETVRSLGTLHRRANNMSHSTALRRAIVVPLSAVRQVGQSTLFFFLSESCGVLARAVCSATACSARMQVYSACQLDFAWQLELRMCRLTARSVPKRARNCWYQSVDCCAYLFDAILQ